MKRVLTLALILTGGCLTLTRAQATETISSGDIQRFEQTYEVWAQEIIQGMLPGTKATTIAQIEFSKTSDQIDAYEELKASQHLPGLPEVSDPNVSNPLDNPLSALVARRSIKVLFHNDLTPGTEKIVAEVIRAKMKLNSTDPLTFETLKVGQPPAPVDHSNASPTSLIGMALIIAMAALVIHRARKRASSPTHRKNSETGPAEPSLPNYHKIMTARPQVRREALKFEKTEVIAKAVLNCSTRFNHELLGDLEQGQFDDVNQWLIHNNRPITLSESNYSRMLISARIQQHETQDLLNTFKPSEASL